MARIGIVLKMIEWLENRKDLACLRRAIAEDDGTRYTHAEVLETLAKENQPKS